MFFRTALWLVLFFYAQKLSAQNQPDSTQGDSLILEEVTVYGFSLQRFSAGSKVDEIDSAIISRFNVSSLADLLQQQSAIYLKTYGNGMSSTINFRGTSASHTAVLWNGININSLSLGLTDFSILPVFAFDKIGIHHGAASGLYGSDAIGGTIQLGSEPLWTRGFKAHIQQDAGSFGNFGSSISTRFGNGKWEGKTGFYFRKIENDFPYINTTRFNNPRENQHDASIQHAGIIQDLNYKISPKSFITINSWWNESDRQIQPTMTVRESEDRQIDRNLRLSARYHLQNVLGMSIFRTAYIEDFISFNGSESLIKRINTALEHDFTITNNLNIKTGADWNHIVADVSGHGSEIKENRNDVFLLVRYVPSRRWFFSLNLRQPFVTGFQAPFAPAAGLQYLILDQNEHELTGKLNISKNYRVPTLNDRFWLRGGNPDLLPEKSLNSEAGLLYKFKKDNYSSETEITSFYNQIDNWIAWRPGEVYWYADNIKAVEVRGLEMHHRSAYTWGQVNLTQGINYSYTKSINSNSANREEAGKQLIYMPEHNGLLFSEISFKGWLINPRLNYTGLRYTTADNARSLPSFTLFDAHFGKKIKWENFEVDVLLRLNNITNTTYQNYEYRAMPGRNFLLSVRVDFK
ncbi:TonB-dependent receptor [soil metagenome]